MKCILAIVTALTTRREQRGRQSRGKEEETGNRRERERLGRGHCPVGRGRQSRGEGEERGRQSRIEEEERGRQRRREEAERGRQRRQEEEERGRQRSQEEEERGNKRERERREHCPIVQTCLLYTSDAADE